MNYAKRRLLARTGELGTHFKRQLLVLDKSLDHFLDRMESRRMMERLDLWRTADDPRAGMALVTTLTDDPDEELRFLRTYFAVQFLLLDLGAGDKLKLALASRRERTVAYRDFVVTLGNAFVRLSTAYLESLVRHFVVGAKEMEWALLGVGTLRDQDDIDVALIDDGGPGHEAFNAGFARIAHEMLRSASPLHFYLAERMGGTTYTAPLAAFVDLADREVYDHVLLSEIGNSSLLLGSKHLYRAFQERVADRYFQGARLQHRYHEVFVRGLTGEVRTLLLGHLPHDRIHFKNDGLRIIKGLTHVFRAIHGVHVGDPFRALDQLAGLPGQSREHFRRLSRSLAFLETMRTLYQIYHVQDEDVVVDGSGEALDRVADTMGYRRRGVLTPHTQLLADYYDEVQTTRRVAEALVQEVKRYLQQTGAIHCVLHDPQPGGNRARAFVRSLRDIPGNRYWYDVIEALEEPGQSFLPALVADFASLSEAERLPLVDDFVAWARDNLFALMHFTRLLHAAGTPQARDLARALNLAFLEQGGTRDFPARLAELFQLVPALFQEYLSLLSPDEARRLAALLTGVTLVDEGVARTVSTILSLGRLYHSTSRFCSRIGRAVALAHPEYLSRLDNPEFLSSIGNGLLAMAGSTRNVTRRKEFLTEYFRVEWLRCSRMLLQGVPLDVIHREYTDFSDAFFTTLYRVARREAQEDLGQGVETRDCTAIFATGGRGREEAFDDDLDLIVVSDGLSEEGLAFLQHILARMNHVIVRLGVFPQYRMADHFGSFVTPLPVLADHLRRDDPNIFLDMTEFLELRMVEGNAHFHSHLRKTLVDGILFHERREYLLGALAHELSDRRAYFSGKDHPQRAGINVKEHPGGLREMELALLYHKVAKRLHLPVNLDLFERIAALEDLLPDERGHGADLRALREHFGFLKRLRHLNRVLVAVDDTLRPDTAELLAPHAGCRSGAALIVETWERMRDAQGIVTRLVLV
jgi:hypothetical protein